MSTPTIGGRWEIRQLLAVLTVIAVTIATMLLFSGTAQAEHVDSWPFSNEANQATFWEDWGESEEGEDDWVCDKVDDQGSTGTYTLGDPPAGHEWRLLIAKKTAGDEANTLYWNPVSGGEYESALGDGYSHIIVCSRPGDEETTTTFDDTTTTAGDTTTSAGDTTTSAGDTTTSAGDTTTSAGDTTTSAGDTTTSAGDTTSTVEVSETTVSTISTTSAEVEGTVVTTAPEVDPDEDLPFTGLDAGTLMGLSAVLIGGGLAALAMTRRPSED